MKRLTCFATLMLWALGAHSATFTWDSNPSLTGVQDGSGTWTLFGSNNWHSGGNVQWSNSSQNSAIFGNNAGTAGTVTVTNITVDDITFNPPSSGNYLLTGGTLTLTGSPVITTNATATIRSTLVGSIGFTKRGTETLNLQASVNGQQNSISGNIIVEAGTLILGGGTNLFASDRAIGGPVIIRSGGTLKLGQSEVIGSGFELPNITIDSGGTFDLSGHDETIGRLGGQGNVVLTSGNRLVLSGQNTTPLAGPFTGVLSGSGSLQVRALTSQSNFIHSGDHLYTGATLIGGDDGGIPTLSIPKITNGGIAGPLGKSSAAPDNLRFHKGVLAYTGATASTDRGALFNGPGLIDVTKHDTELTFEGILRTLSSADIAQKALIKRGLGTLILAGSANNAGATAIVESGTLILAKESNSSVHAIDAQGEGLRIFSGTQVRLSGSGDDQLSATTTITVSGTLDLNGRSEGLDSITGTGRVFNGALGTVSSFILGQGNGSSIFKGTLEDGSGQASLVKTGTGTIVLEGTNAYTGGTFVNGGTLVLASPIKPSPLMVNAGGVLVTNGVFQTVNVAAGGSLVLDSFPNGGSARQLTGTTVIFGPGSTKAHFDMGVLSDDTILHDRIHAESDLTLGGVTDITLQVGSGGLANGTYTLFTYAGALHGNETNLNVVERTSYRQDLSFLPTSSTPGSVQLSVSGNTADLTWQGATPGSIWDLASTANWKNAGADDKFYHLDTVRFDDSGAASPDVVLQGNLNPTSVHVANNTVPYTFSGPGSLTRGTTLLKSGSGTLLITNANSYTGGTAVNGGVLKIANPSALGTGTVTVSAGGTLDLNGVTLSTGSGALTISGTGAAGQGSLINNGITPLIGTSGLRNLHLADDAIVGGITDWGFAPGAVVNGGNHTLTKTGPNTVVWNAASSTILGAMVLEQGRLLIQSSNSLGDASSQITVRSGAEIATTGTVNQVKPLVFESSRLSSDGTGKATWHGTVSLAGNSDQPITLNTSGSASSSSLVIEGKLSGSNGFQKTGSGVLELRNSSNDYSGPTLVKEGALRVGGAGKLPSNTELHVESELRLSGVSQSVSSLTGNGMIRNDGGDNALTLTANQSRNTEFTGQISNIIFSKTGPGSLALAGQSLSSLRAQVTDGTLVLAKTNTSAIRGSSNPGEVGLTVNNTGVVRLSGIGGNQIENGAEVSLNSGGTLDLGGMSEAIDGLLGNGGRITNSGLQTSTLQIGTASFSNVPNATASFSGTIQDGTSPISLMIFGGTQILEGIHTYTGSTTVGASLFVNGAIPNSPIFVQLGTLGGTGQLNAVTIGERTENISFGGTLSPGSTHRAGNTGTLSMSSLSFKGVPTVQFDVASKGPNGNMSDLIRVQDDLKFLNTTQFAVNLLDGHLEPGDYPLIEYGGSLTGKNAQVTLGSDIFGTGIPSQTRQTFTVDAESVAGAVVLNVTGNSASLHWRGDGNSATAVDEWNHDDQNWMGGEKFYNLDNVIFDDVGAVSSPRVAIDIVTFGSKLIVNNSAGHDYWFTGGSFRGNGRLIKSGSGTLHLERTFAEHGGGTHISQGTIISKGYTFGTAPITLGDENTGNEDIALLLTGPFIPASIPASVTVSAEGTGDVTLGAVSTTSQLSYQFSGPLILNRPTTLLHSGSGESVVYYAISGNVGTLTVTGGRKTVWPSANNFVGDIVITGEGTVLSTGENSIPAGTNVEIGQGASFETYQSKINALTGNGSVRPSFTLGYGNGSGTFDGQITGAGTITKVGAGTQTFMGDSPFTGTFRLEEGTIAVNGKIAGARVDVMDSGILSGNGSVGMITLQPGGRLEPGSGLGTFFAQGLRWHGGAWIGFELGMEENSDLLNLGSGALTKEAGTSFTFDFGGTGEVNATYVLATFGSTPFRVGDFTYSNLAEGLTGTFQLTSNTLSFTTVPEPAGVAFLALSSCILGVRRLRRASTGGASSRR